MLYIYLVLSYATLLLVGVFLLFFGLQCWKQYRITAPLWFFACEAIKTIFGAVTPFYMLHLAKVMDAGFYDSIQWLSETVQPISKLVLLLANITILIIACSEVSRILLSKSEKAENSRLFQRLAYMAKFKVRAGWIAVAITFISSAYVIIYYSFVRLVHFLFS